MSNNEFMYAVERSDEYLAHYGIRGMKWGVRRAIKSGNSNRLDKQYKKAQKKLAKLEKQAGNTKKYARRAALMGAGAAAAGTVAGLGASRTFNEGAKLASKAGHGVVSGLNGLGIALSRSKNAKIKAIGSGITKGTTGRHLAVSNAYMDSLKTHSRIQNWERGTDISKNAGKAVSNFGNTTLKGAGKVGAKTSSVGGKIANSGVTNGTIARVGAGVIGAGLAAGAARNAYKAATAKKRAAKFRSAMNESFKGTKYANGGQPRQGNKKRRNRG